MRDTKPTSPVYFTKRYNAVKSKSAGPVLSIAFCILGDDKTFEMVEGVGDEGGLTVTCSVTIWGVEIGSGTDTGTALGGSTSIAGLSTSIVGSEEASEGGVDPPRSGRKLGGLF